MPHKLINYPKDPRLTHAFSAFYPDLPESREVIHHLIHFFEHTGDDCKGGYVS
jgi:mannose/cellobiose epimerase-like protein (N-acyl-D-glucosamine 2-epimerase family)